MEIPTVSMKVSMKIWICINVHGLVIYLPFMFNVNGILFPKVIHPWYVHNFYRLWELSVNFNRYDFCWNLKQDSQQYGVLFTRVLEICLVNYDHNRNKSFYYRMSMIFLLDKSHVLWRIVQFIEQRISVWSVSRYVIKC